jgi:hypothetical protein
MNPTLHQLAASLELSVPVDKDRHIVSENLKLCCRWREKAVRTVMLLGDVYQVKDSILAYSVALQDKYLAAVILARGGEADISSETLSSIEKCNNAQSVSAACFVLANKFVGSSTPRMGDIVRVLRLECPSAQIESSEEDVLKFVDWSLHLTTGHVHPDPS